MLVLHAISGSDDPGALALVCGMRDAGVECVVLAQAGSATAVRAAALSLSTIALGGGARAGEIGRALSLVDPDLVHVHGMRGHGPRRGDAPAADAPAADAPAADAPAADAPAADAPVPGARTLGARADVVTLGEADLDADGLPAIDGGFPDNARCAVVLPAGASRDEALVRARLPRHVRSVAWASRLPVTQCAGLYVTAARFSPSRAGHGRHGVVTGRATP